MKDFLNKDSNPESSDHDVGILNQSMNQRTMYCFFCKWSKYSILNMHI